MSHRLRKSLYGGLIIGLLAFIVIGLAPGESAPETDAERAHRIASQLRCPFCNGESIADAQSSIGADLRDLIDEQIASGMSDEEIFDFYVSVYTDRVLLLPPLFGWGALLWVLPLVVLGGGAVAVARRRRPQVAPSELPSAAALAEARRTVAEDLHAVEVQAAAGELAAAEAERLRGVYEAEAAALDAATVTDPPPRERSRRRVAAGAAILVLGGAALTVAVVLTVRDRAPGDLVTGGIAAEGAGRDLSTVTNEEMEQVVAANPEVIPMRLALAGRYFEAGDFSAALGHYMEVLQREQHPEALANIGWMTYLSGEVETGLAFVERSLQVTDELPQSYWYLANIRYWGLEDPGGAVAPLETLLGFEAIPEEIRSAATELLAEVQAAP